MSRKEGEYNCLSFVAYKLGWSTNEQSSMSINRNLKGYGFNLERFLLLYARHVGRTTVPNVNFGLEANVVTFSTDLFSYDSGDIEIEHIAVIDQKNPLKIYQRKSWRARKQNVLIKNSGYLGVGSFSYIDYWKVPETENIKGFLDEKCEE